MKDSPFKHLAGEPYFPSNGTEGMYFEDAFCSNCIHEKFCHTQDHDDAQCEIWNKALIGDERPEEWVYDEQGHPTCRAYKYWDWGRDDDGNITDPPEPEPYNPMQLVLPFILEDIYRNTAQPIELLPADI